MKQKDVEYVCVYVLMSEWVSERMSERVSEWASEQVSEREKERDNSLDTRRLGSNSTWKNTYKLTNYILPDKRKKIDKIRNWKLSL